MSRSTKSNIRPTARVLTSAHVMTPEQQARRWERYERQIGIPGLAEIGRYRYANAYEGLRLRSHPAGLEICFLARGQQTYRVNNEIYRLRGGDQYLVFPGEPHDSAGMPEEKGVLYWVFIRLKAPRQPLFFLDPAASRALRQALLTLPSRHFAAEPGTHDLLEEIFHAIDRAKSKLDRIGAATLVLRYLFSTLRASHRNQRATPSPRIQRALTHIAENTGELPSVPQLARLVRLSPSRFKARFREEVGLPPREHVLRHRLALAQTRLSRPGATVTAVAHELGFSSSQYFATVFRRFTGSSPRIFAQRETLGSQTAPGEISSSVKPTRARNSK
ncbi:MAG: helix-turn-helix-domain containing protein AraC type [Verrucomicrobia bacterium]|nr:helix-turn-helix-domain containing protein AraC type [Verrucomicrobiota bacterium]